MCDKRSCQRYLAALERKGVIRRLRPENQGRSMRVFYFFAELDEIPKGWQGVTLLFAERVAKGRQKGGGRVTESQLALLERAQEREPEPEQKQIPPPNPLVTEGERVTREMSDAGKTEDRAASVASKCVPIRAAGTGEGSHRADGDAERSGTCGGGGGDRGGEHPPGGARGGDASSSALVEEAVGQLMRQCGFAEDRRLRAALRDVLRMEASERDGPFAAAVAAVMVAMAEAWEGFTDQGERLRFKWDAPKFFKRGYWAKRESWPWDNEVLKRERMEVEARVGSR